MIRSNREIARERMSGETVLDALARRQAERAPAAPEAPRATPAASAPGALVINGGTGLPSREVVAREVGALASLAKETLAQRLGFAELTMAGVEGLRAAQGLLRRLGTPDGCFVDLDLRAMIADVAGWTEPPFPDWVKVGAYCRRQNALHAGAPPRMVVAIEGTEAILNGGERVPAGYLRRGWEQVWIADGVYVQLDDLSACVPAPVSAGGEEQAMLDQAAAAIDAYLSTKRGGGVPSTP